jgi:DNA processing protein
MDYSFIPYNSPSFPRRLKNIPDPPKGIYIKGGLPDDELPAVAVIGARNNSFYGRQAAQTITKELARLGLVIVSGMARGLDTHAHNAALDANGQTIAVLPCGIDICYPPSNIDLYKQIPQSGGALVSEFAPGTKIHKGSFHIRNRIIAGLADILIVIEAGERSGTFVTTDHALNQGKEVLAVPGSIFSKHSVGTNLLIKQGATPITTYLDALNALKIPVNEEKQDVTRGTFSEENPQESKLTIASNESLVYSCINYEPVSIEYIVYKTSIDIATTNMILLEMELAGKVAKLAGSKYIRK